MAEKTFNLTWNNHLANLSGLFEGLYKSGSLTDTTLACQGGMLRAHRLVLAACSPYFERVFKEHYGEQPILILKGVSVEEMECLLDFMYRGSIDVAEEHLTSLIRTATDLEIRGLSPDHRIDSVHSHARVETRMQKRHIETRVQTTEYIKESTSDPFLPKQSLIDSVQDQVKMEEIEVEDDPMVIDHDDSFDSPLPPPNEQIRHIPPPMFKRETRFKGQKRVSVGRPMKSHDVTESSKTKDRVSMREMSHEEFVEEAIQMSKVKEESMFNSNSSDPTEPTVQLNEDIYEHEREITDSPTCGTKNADNFAIDEPNASGPKKKMENAKRGTTAGEDEAKEGSRSYMKSDKAQYKPFSCDLCTLAFTRASHLARHRRVHTGERPFACTLCPRMFARQDKLKQHLDSHLQWPKRRALTNLTSGGVHSVSAVTTKGKRGRPRKITLEQSAMEEFMKFGEFSSLLNKSRPVNSTDKNEQASTGFPKQVRDPKMKEQRVQEEEEEEEEEEGEQTDDSSLFRNTDSYGCQVENGQDIV